MAATDGPGGLLLGPWQCYLLPTTTLEFSIDGGRRRSSRLEFVYNDWSYLTFPPFFSSTPSNNVAVPCVYTRITETRLRVKHLLGTYSFSMAALAQIPVSGTALMYVSGGLRHDGSSPPVCYI